MKKQFLLLGVFFVQSAVADYRFELATGFDQLESDTSRDRVLSLTPPIVSNYYINSEEDREIDAFTVGGKIYFSSVSTSGVPLREAGFLSQSGGAYFVVGKNEEEISVDDYSVFEGVVGNQRYSKHKAKGYDFETGVEFITPGIPFVLQLGALYSEGEYKTQFTDGLLNPSYKADLETFGYSAGVGIYYTDSGRILYSYNKEEEERDFEDPSDFYDVETITHLLGIKHIFQFSDHISLKLQAGWEREEIEIDDSASEYEDNTYSVAIAFYPMSSLEISTEITSGDVELSDESYDISHQSVELGVHYFFTENFGAGLSYVISEADYNDSHLETFVFGSITDALKHQYDERAINFNLSLRF